MTKENLSVKLMECKEDIDMLLFYLSDHTPVNSISFSEALEVFNPVDRLCEMLEIMKEKYGNEIV